MNRHLPFVGFALASLLTGQSTYSVLPAGYENLQDTYQDMMSLGAGGKDRFGNKLAPMHIQTGYAMSDLGVGLLQVKKISFRRNNYFKNEMPQSTTTLAIYMSRSAVATTAYSTTFTKNQGPSLTQVFGKNGKPAILNWPTTLPVKNGQKVMPFTLKIPLVAPYVVVKATGGSLCIDYSIANRVLAAAFVIPQYDLILDAAGKARSELAGNGRAGLWCTFSSTQWFQMGITYDTRGLTTEGGPWSLAYHAVPPNSLGLATLSSYGVETKPNPYKLPIDMAAMGAPHCAWNVGLETGFWLALKADSKGVMRWPTLTIPKGMPASSFFDGCLVLDPKANSLGMVPTSSSEWQIVQAHTPKCVTVYRHRDTSPPAKTGTIAPAFAAVIRLDA